MPNFTQPPSVRTVIPSDAPTTQKTRQTGDLITHLSKQDNHLWQALTSLQSQVNDVVRNTTDWTRWDPKIYDNNMMPLVKENVASYYMRLGQLMFISIFGLVTVTATAKDVRIDLPMDLGDTVYKTCVVYLSEPWDDPTVNGVVDVYAQRQLMVITIRPELQGLKCRLSVGGPLGIIQGV